MASCIVDVWKLLLMRHSDGKDASEMIRVKTDYITELEQLPPFYLKAFPGIKYKGASTPCLLYLPTTVTPASFSGNFAGDGENMDVYQLYEIFLIVHDFCVFFIPTSPLPILPPNSNSIKYW